MEIKARARVVAEVPIETKQKLIELAKEYHNGVLTECLIGLVDDAHKVLLHRRKMAEEATMTWNPDIEN